MLVCLLLLAGQIHPRKEALHEQRKGVLVHVERLSSGRCLLLLVVLDVGEVYSLNSVAEIVSVDIGVSTQLERNRLCLSISQAKTL